MPIPNIPIFIELLQNFTLEKPDDIQHYENLVIVNKTFGTDKTEDGRYKRVEFPELYLWYKPSSQLSADALLSKIQKELEISNHPNTLSLAKILLTVSVLHRRFKQEPVESLNKVLSNITTAKLIQIFVFPQILSLEGQFTVQNFKIGNFDIGKLHSEQLRRLCLQAGSDFYDKYSSDYIHRLSIDRQATLVTLFNFINCKKILSFPIPLSGLSPKPDVLFKDKMLSRLMSEYFNILSNYHRERFTELLLEDQHLLVAYGAPYFDAESITKIHASNFISIFLEIGGKNNLGWVEPGSLQQSIDLAQADIRIPQITERLQNDFNFTNFRNSEIHQTIKSFSLFVSKAKRHCFKNNFDEGFLHYIIALDLLLGEKGSSTKSVTDRTSVLVFQRFGKSFANQQKEIETFDIRSKYVHAGVNVKTEAIKEIESICEEVLHCLLRLQLQKENHSDGFIKKWIRNLDFLVKAVEADREQEKSIYIENGIWHYKSS